MNEDRNDAASAGSYGSGNGGGITSSRLLHQAESEATDEDDAGGGGGLDNGNAGLGGQPRQSLLYQVESNDNANSGRLSRPRALSKIAATAPPCGVVMQHAPRSISVPPGGATGNGSRTASPSGGSVGSGSPVTAVCSLPLNSGGAPRAPAPYALPRSVSPRYFRPPPGTAGGPPPPHLRGAPPPWARGFRPPPFDPRFSPRGMPRRHPMGPRGPPPRYRLPGMYLLTLATNK